MTDLLHSPGSPNGEQLQLDVDLLTPPAMPVDAEHEIVHSPAYQQLEALRDEAYARRRSGARAIAREALAALQKGELTRDEYTQLFSDRGGSVATARRPDFDELSAERPSRALDWAELAAGEGVRRPGEDE